jgi:ribosome-associated protein
MRDQSELCFSLFTQLFRRMSIEIAPHLLLPDESISLRFIRSSGPGGQNVNKVASAVQLRFTPTLYSKLGANTLLRLGRLAGKRLTDSGEIVINAQRHRTQENNKRDAFERLAEMIDAALIEPKIRRTTKPTRASKQRRLEGKTQRGQIKQRRARVAFDD